jgi:hypothetical protein
MYPFAYGCGYVLTQIGLRNEIRFGYTVTIFATAGVLLASVLKKLKVLDIVLRAKLISGKQSSSFQNT